MTSTDSVNDAIQDRLTKTTPPMDVAIAEKLLHEVKEIMDRLGVRFFLRQGTCLGAVRTNAFIPWDDDLDLGVVIGLNGFTEQSIGPVLAAFRESGYYVKAQRAENLILSTLLKNNIRIDLLFHRVIDGQIYHWPGLWFPVSLFNQMKEIDFIGKKFLVPNPPEEYLRIKYGPNWRIPKRFDYAKDVVDNIPVEPAIGLVGKLNRFLTGLLHPGDVSKLRVLDKDGRPVHLAEVRIVGLGCFRSDMEGYAKLYLPRDGSAVENTYAIVVSYGDHEEVLYEEVLARKGSYVYRPDPAQTEGRIFVLSEIGD